MRTIIYNSIKENVEAKKFTFLSLAVICMSVFFSHSNIIFGVNASLSDIFAVVCMLLLIVENKMYIPGKEAVFLIFLSIIVIITSLILVPIVFSIETNLIYVCRDFVKLIVLFLYFVIGFNLYRFKNSEIIFKWFAIGTLIMGTLSILYTLLDIPAFHNTLFFGGIRFKGLMNDPNYFSILQLCGIAYFARLNIGNRFAKYISILIIGASIITSGSKTGLISLVIYFLFYQSENIIKSFKTYKQIPSAFFRTLISIAFVLLMIMFSEVFFKLLMEYVPAFSRVYIIFTDFSSAISSEGSSRNHTWSVAIELISRSPIVGIGIGTYTELSNYLFDFGGIAHNTYLQLSVEWGLLLASIFITYVFYNVKYCMKTRVVSKTLLTARDIIIILMVASMAISLNNARLFWVALGIIVASRKEGEVNGG